MLESGQSGEPESQSRGVQAACPVLASLLELIDGGMSEHDLEIVAAHLETCETCETVVRELAVRSGGPPAGDELDFSARPTRGASAAYSLMEREAKALAAATTVQRREPQVGPKRSALLESEVGLVIGPYEVVDLLGRGGMGVVYRAVHKHLKRVVALKTIARGRAVGDDAVARFRAEGEAVARLEHPNIVHIHDFDECDGTPYFSMELVVGETLARKLKRGPMGFREAAELVRTLALAIDYAHGRRIVHRDLKPSNVLIAADGTPKVSDFGVAKFLDEDRAELTRTDMVVGTPAYMAPEQTTGKGGEIGPRTDVYALGAILYEALTGKPVFQGDNHARVLDLVRTGQVVAPTVLRKEVPANLEAICLKCLEKLPANRYFNSKLLAEDLTRWLGNEKPLGPPGRVRRFGRGVRRRGRAILAVATGAILAAGWSVAWYVAAPPPPRTDPPEVLREIEAKLDRGEEVELIGATGMPKWYRWRKGEANSKLSLGKNQCFEVNTLTTGMIELLPDSRTETYSVTADLQHTFGQQQSQIGIYFSDHTYPGGESPLHFHMQLQFNDWSTNKDSPKYISKEGVAAVASKNTAHLKPQFGSDPGRDPPVEMTFGGVIGAEFKPSNGSKWRRLVITADRTGVRVDWDGDKLAMTEAGINSTVGREFAKIIKSRMKSDAFVQQADPEYKPRGGLGLNIRRSTINIKNLIIRPLKPVN
ncbi:serine/threonine protein kinase [Fimbriiglobus ruber]|uniref:Serine/threonine protein kinase PrkC, regulator of stationary phase n=1 Tax=Fimbriiglobus ruber TaxID=1908690 RepID=A0A225E5F2_9BACT|nr:serine/threonine-protein kinase [Fimbriiglobus ruber]OWK45336.1 Serine/threonine protein kinase PrkC, regulator of stationary phase [Fimbriiglobus ruber]